MSNIEKAAYAQLAAHGKGVLLKKSLAQSIANNAPTMVSWDGEIYDDSNFFDIASPTKIIIPDGVSKVILKANSAWDGNVTGYRSIQIIKNGDSNGEYMRSVVTRIADTVRSNSNIVTPIMNVVQGDYFELLVLQTSGNALNFTNNFNSWFSLEVVK
jgi:hypothetical protein